MIRHSVFKLKYTVNLINGKPSLQLRKNKYKQVEQSIKSADGDASTTKSFQISDFAVTLMIFLYKTCKRNASINS